MRNGSRTKTKPQQPSKGAPEPVAEWESGFPITKPPKHLERASHRESMKAWRAFKKVRDDPASNLRWSLHRVTKAAEQDFDMLRTFIGCIRVALDEGDQKQAAKFIGYSETAAKKLHAKHKAEARGPAEDYRADSKRYDAAWSKYHRTQIRRRKLFGHPPAVPDPLFKQPRRKGANPKALEAKAAKAALRALAA